MLNNFGEMVARVKHELRGLPDVEATRTHLQQVVNEVHHEFCMRYDWPFMREIRQFIQLPDIEFGLLEVALYEDPPPKDASSERVLYTVGSNLLPLLGLDATYVPVLAEIMQHFIGGELHLVTVDESPLVATEGNYQAAPFEIQAVWTSSTGPLDAPDYGLFWIVLEDRCRLITLSRLHHDVIARFPRVRIPADVSEVRWIRERRQEGDRAQTRCLKAIDSAHGVALPENQQGDPECWWPSMGRRTRWPSAGIQAGGWPLTNPVRSIDPLLGRRQSTPFNGMGSPSATIPGGWTATATNTTSGDAVLAPGKYKVALAWMVAGRLSPMSQPLEVTISGTNDSITLGDLPQRELYWHSWHLTVWVSFRDGPFYLAQSQGVFQTTAQFPIDGGDGTAPLADPSSLVLTRDHFDWQNPDAMIRWDDVYAGPDHRYIELWPRPETTKWFEMEVTRRPRELLQDTDTTHLPVEFNDLIVYEVVHRIAAVKHSDTEVARNARAIADRRLEALLVKMGMNRAVRHQKRSFTDAGSSGHPLGFYDPIIVVPAPPVIEELP